MFDAKKFIQDNFGSAAGVIAHCRAMGVEPPNEQAVWQWFRRGSIPGAWLTRLVALLEAERGEAVSLAEYMGVPK